MRESDGSVRTWQVNTASVPFMGTPGDRFAIRWRRTSAVRRDA
nr:hypothetical protein [Salmonella enterica]